MALASARDKVWALARDEAWQVVAWALARDEAWQVVAWALARDEAWQVVAWALAMAGGELAFEVVACTQAQT